MQGSTYSMVGALNKIPIALIGLIFFKSPTTKVGLLGISLGLLGGIVFTVLLRPPSLALFLAPLVVSLPLSSVPRGANNCK